jgi:hypothetical protein
MYENLCPKLLAGTNHKVIMPGIQGRACTPAPSGGAHPYGPYAMREALASFTHLRADIACAVQRCCTAAWQGRGGRV